jgi:hypothetical protein
MLKLSIYFVITLYTDEYHKLAVRSDVKDTEVSFFYKLKYDEFNCVPSHQQSKCAYIVTMHKHGVLDSKIFGYDIFLCL